jgi:hypothetical protein
VTCTITAAARRHASAAQRGLHYDQPAFEFSFGGSFEELVYFLLHLLPDLLPSAFLAYRAWDILDVDKVGLQYRSAEIGPRAALSAFSWHGTILLSFFTFPNISLLIRAGMFVPGYLNSIVMTSASAK